MKKVIIYIVAIILVVILGVVLGKSIKKNTEANPTSSNNIVNMTNNIANNTNQNKTENKTNNIENKIDDETQEYQNNQEETKDGPVVDEKTDTEKAISIVKKDWGDDNSVYFAEDGRTGTGEYIVCVREKETTNALAWYTVNVETGTFEKE